MRRTIAILGLLSGLVPGPVRAEESIQPEVFQAFEIFAQVQELVKANYLEPVDPGILVRGALDGMILAVDRYGSYLDRGEPLELPSQRAEAAAGVILGIQGGHLTALRVLPGGAAEAAGLRSGDRIYLIGEKAGFRMTLREADRLLSGRAGDELALTVGRPREQRTIDLELTLAPLPPSPPPVLEELTADILILRAGSRLDDRVGRLIQEGVSRRAVRALVIDLRRSATGETIAGIEAAQRLLPQDRIVAVARGREGQPDRIWHGRNGEAGPPRLVVLIGPTTAGGAEILAAAVQRAEQGLLVGQPSFGQALLQESIPLEEGGTLRVTVAHFLDGQEERITGRGLTPDHPVEEQDGEDPVLSRALELLQETQPEPA